jgi:hypothetical protein
MHVMRMGMRECMSEEGEWMIGALRRRERDYLNKSP